MELCCTTAACHCLFQNNFMTFSTIKIHICHFFFFLNCFLLRRISNTVLASCFWHRQTWNNTLAHHSSQDPGKSGCDPFLRYCVWQVTGKYPDPLGNLFATKRNPLEYSKNSTLPQKYKNRTANGHIFLTTASFLQTCPKHCHISDSVHYHILW